MIGETPDAAALCNMCGTRPVAPSRNGKAKRCAECRALVRSKLNPEATRAASRKWRETHHEQALEAQRRWRERNPNYQAEWWTKNFLRNRARRYGMTFEQFEFLLEQQRGLCSICDRPLVLKGKGGAQVDHDRKSGAVRGILCRACNVGLGMFGEDPDRMAVAITYLQTKT